MKERIRQLENQIFKLNEQKVFFKIRYNWSKKIDLTKIDSEIKRV